MINGFSNIMQKSGTFGDPYIQSDLAGQKSCKLCDFHRMLQRILSIAGTEFHASRSLISSGWIP